MSIKKVLFVANITKHILRFHLPYLKWFQENGFETHVAANGLEEVPYCNVKHTLPVSRSPFSWSNIVAYRILKKIINKNNYFLIHGHTPVGGFLARASSVIARRKGTKVLYTAHGFHFFKGAPLKNWMLYYPMEKLLSRYTDAIITINSEDYQVLFDRNFKSQGKFLISGVGVNEDRFHTASPSVKSDMRKRYGYNDEQFLLMYVAEFIKRKNHRFIIKSTVELLKTVPNLKILFAGRGILLDKMKLLAESLGVSETIDFLGFRDDVEKFMAISDVGISASRHEGLGLNLAEEMLTGLPVVASQDRGHRELINHGINGFLFEQNDQQQFITYVQKLSDNKNLRVLFGKKSVEIAQKFTLSNALLAMEKIYNNYID